MRESTQKWIEEMEVTNEDTIAMIEERERLIVLEVIEELKTKIDKKMDYYLRNLPIF